jgi:hypothetical protein
MILPFKIPVSLKIMENEYSVDEDSVTTLLQVHLE